MGLNNREWGRVGGGVTQSVRGNYKSFKGINPTVLERICYNVVVI